MTPLLSEKNKTDKYRIVIVDDHPVVRYGMAELFARESDVEICGEAANVAQAMQQVEATHPDLVIVDISLEGDNGIHLIQRIRTHHPEVKMLVSSMHDETIFAPRALRAGAHGYINKAELTESFIGAVRTVLQGKFYVSPGVASDMLHRSALGEHPGDEPTRSLTNRELEVFEMIGQGLNMQEISCKLKLSPKTIESHRTSIRVKLNLPNSRELSRLACLWMRENH